MIFSRYLLVSSLAIALVSGCKSKDSGVPVPMPSAAPSVNAPVAGGRAASRQGDVIEGKVAETFDVGMYTYLRLETPKGEQWAAVPKSKVAVGDQVSVQQAMPMKKFHSPTLNRDFELIYFGVLPGAAASAHPPMSPHPSAAASVPPDIQVPKAKVPNAHTVEEIAKEGAKLAGKPVAIQGMVVKVNTGILDRNWIHIQDGTGSKDSQTNDLLVTSKDQARVGEVVLVKGKVATDKDFGSGYAYKILVEEASITVQK